MAKDSGKSLKTSSFAVAQARLEEFMKEHHERPLSEPSMPVNALTGCSAIAGLKWTAKTLKMGR